MRELQRTLIRRMHDDAPPDALQLGLGQPDLPSPPAVCLGGVRGIVNGETGYTPTGGIPELRSAVAERYGAFAAGPESVVITVGTQEALFASCMALVDPGDEILVPDPGYPAYPVVARLIGARPVRYRLRPEHGFRLDVAEIERRISQRTRLLILSEPSNPTGAFSGRDTLAELAGLLRSRAIPWLSDEIYAGLTYEREFVSLAELAPGCGLVISGLSKDASMTGWRLGWVVGSPEIVARIVAVHQYLVTCAPSISQAAALAALAPAGLAARAEQREIFARRRKVMAEALARLPGARFALPDGAFYFFVDVSRHGDSLALSRRILERRKVLTVPGVAFGPSGEGYLRLSYAAPEPVIREGVRRIARELRGGGSLGF